jgi:hypothetical protein
MTVGASSSRPRPPSHHRRTAHRGLCAALLTGSRIRPPTIVLTPPGTSSAFATSCSAKYLLVQRWPRLRRLPFPPRPPCHRRRIRLLRGLSAAASHRAAPCQRPDASPVRVARGPVLRRTQGPEVASDHFRHRRHGRCRVVAPPMGGSGRGRHEPGCDPWSECRLDRERAMPLTLHGRVAGPRSRSRRAMNAQAPAANEARATETANSSRRVLRPRWHGVGSRSRGAGRDRPSDAPSDDSRKDSA